jgi:transcriptional regulator with XRE-family HTH domain
LKVISVWSKFAFMTPLHTYLKSHGMTGGAFAALVGLHPVALSRIRRGHQQPTLAVAFAIEAATGGAVPARSWLGVPAAAADAVPEPAAETPVPSAGGAPS